MASDTKFQCFQHNYSHCDVSLAEMATACGVASLCALIAMLWTVSFSSPAAAAGKEAGLLALLARVEQSNAKVEDYATVFSKHERVDGKLLPG
ncbi:hypothetical protein [Fundidesulfovibrio soli]|uniref:hypothetical protein n=1 Tax=Fundidesulfovibrio soli TaxID=2922716 RepID=UPI001FAFBFEE|nr:hypothetical protein [Fundidesulfovibrio soli]